MELKSLYINKKWGGGGFTGSVCFSNDRGEVKLKLQEDHLAPIVDIMADAIVSQARCVADDQYSETPRAFSFSCRFRGVFHCFHAICRIRRLNLSSNRIICPLASAKA